MVPMIYVLKKLSLIGQVNKILCTFCNVNCSTKIRLVKSYCTSFYGAEIWDLSHNGIEAICLTLLIQYSILFPELCETLRLVDMFYKRMLNFVNRCLNSQSSLLNFVVRCGILSGQMNSEVARNVLECSLSYNTNVDRISRLECISKIPQMVASLHWLISHEAREPNVCTCGSSRTEQDYGPHNIDMQLPLKSI